MDQKRLLLALSVSLVIVLVFTFIQDKFLPHPPPAQTQAQTQVQAPGGSPAAAAQPQAAPAPGPRLSVETPLMQGSIGLTGAVFDDVVLKQYHETTAPDSPLVQIMGRRGTATPNYVQFGWTAPAGVKVPDDTTVWSASAGALTPQSPVTLSWDNGQGLTFQLQLAVDDKYMFTVTQNVLNHGAAPVQLYPWSRVVRDYKPKEQSSWVLFDGPLGVFNGTLKQESYATLKSDGAKAPGGVAYTETAPGGWVGITDKYWLAAVAPDQSAKMTGSMSYGTVTDGDGSAYETSFITATPVTAAPGGAASFTSHVFTGAKVVKILDAYQSQYHIPNFYKAVDFGMLYFLTKPIFFALDWLNSLLGNFGLAIIVFTVGIKLLFFPLASYSYRSMGKMRLIQPKVQALREQFKDDAAKLQQATMELYKTEKINPASGCLPMLLQIPVFFSLYKVIFITIEMRQAPFYGWIHDLSAPDPTNLFNLFGLLPFDPTAIYAPLHLGALPLIMGLTMFLQQKLNPAPADPTQARMFQLMPVIFTFMLAGSPSGLVLYWAWNNLLSVGQQWLIMRQTAAQPRAVSAKS
ncbi:membrane protein insertase YidC [Acidocella sp. KAb 2-4]|uniref:membrane protein insertase YidC n=1 Tax=Acidocella sp. KAb 2-4 TaxID=2885158 RepID=UPI001D093F78|nr:membrane protein insertase YidC [Acidocella sp. KAb 2-4]MCB5943337.1 membrane protein insertase YidC [Acidocella sp. KAb 2-4]